MGRRSFLLALLVLALVAVGCSSGASTQAPAPKPVQYKLDMEKPFGIDVTGAKVKVTGWDKELVEVKAKTAEDLKYLRKQGNSVVFEQQKYKTEVGKDKQPTYELKVPKQTALYIYALEIQAKGCTIQVANASRTNLENCKVLPPEVK